MPRKSAAALSTLRVDGRPSRLSPPDGLGADEAALFRQLVSASEPEHFRRSDMPLLVEYVRACVLAATAAAHLREEGAVLGGKPNAWLTIQEKQIRALTALSMRLRLSPQSRLDPKTVGRDRTAAGPKGSGRSRRGHALCRVSPGCPAREARPGLDAARRAFCRVLPRSYARRLAARVRGGLG